MISLEERERAEIVRSACEASQSTAPLIVPAETIARYRNPPESSIFPLDYAFHLLGDVNGKTVLEYGCGRGLYTVPLAHRAARVIAFDISPDLLAIAKKRVEVNQCEGVELLLGSAHSLPLPDESIDVIFGMAILHHLDLEIASREVRRVLKKGGRAIFKEPLRNSKLYAWLRQFFPKRANVSPFERPFTDEEIKDFAQPFVYSRENLSASAVKDCARLTILDPERSETLRLSRRLPATEVSFTGLLRDGKGFRSRQRRLSHKEAKSLRSRLKHIARGVSPRNWKQWNSSP